MSLEKLKNLGKSKELLLCLEVNPPRGVALEPVFSRLEGNLDGIDFLNITDSALARMKLAPFPFAAILKQRFGIEPLVNLSCRDRNLIAMQGDLLAAWVCGVRSVVALTGDAVTIGDSPERKGVFEVNSIGLLNAIAVLNGGKDLAGNELKGAPDFTTGVVVNPNVKNINAELRRLERKRDAGARYALSQPVFDEVTAAAFLKAAAGIGVPIFLGLLPFKSGEAALSVTNVPGIKISEELKNLAERSAAEDLSDYSIELCLRIAAACREYVCGFHVISGATPKLALRLTKELIGLRRKL